MSKEFPTIKEAFQKLEYFCAYQERCHQEVVSKLLDLRMTTIEIDEILVYLITNNFLNEERFACAFARGKHRMKHWGKIRIVNELKCRGISKYNIDKALQEISDEEYCQTFDNIANKNWLSITEKNKLKKRQKFCDYLLRRGFESQLVYEKVKELESQSI